MTVIGHMMAVILVYLSFNFNIKIYTKVCGTCSEDCTCIEDRVERKVARSMTKSDVMN